MHRKINIQLFLTIFIVLGIYILGFFLRAQETISGNFLFLLDSGRDMMDVKSIVFDHKLTLIGPYTSLGGVFQGPLYYYLLAIPTAIFNGNPWGNILLMLVMSLLVLVIVFYCMRKYFGTYSAIITLTLFALSPEAIAAATYFWNPHPMWIILTLYIFVLYRSIARNKWAQFFLWPLVTLSFHFEMAFGVFLFVATFVYFLLFHRNILIKNRYFWIGLLLSGIFFLPQIVFDIRHDFLMSRSVIEIFKGSNQGLITSGEKSGVVAILLNNYGTLRNNFMSSFIKDKPFEFFPGLILFLSIVTLIYARYTKSFSQNEKVFIHAVFSVIIMISLLCLIYPFPLRYWFLTGFQSFYLVLIGLILSKLFYSKFGRGLLLGLLSILLFYSVQRLDTLYVHPIDDGGYAKIKGKTQAIDYIYQNASDKNFGIIIFTPPVLTDAYDYLIWWHGQRKYGYIPHNEKKGVVYLLIEPDPGQPWSYKGWLETVIKTGDIMETQTLPSGIIIQKRNFR